MTDQTPQNTAAIVTTQLAIVKTETNRLAGNADVPVEVRNALLALHTAVSALAQHAGIDITN